MHHDAILWFANLYDGYLCKDSLFKEVSILSASISAIHACKTILLDTALRIHYNSLKLQLISIPRE